MRKNVFCFPSLLSDSLCDKIIETGLSYPAQDGTTFSEDDSQRNSVIRWIKDWEPISSKLLPYINMVNAKAFNVDIQQAMSELQFTEYLDAYGGYYERHHDIDYSSDENNDRKLSVSVQLSDPDDYVGGDIEFFEVQGLDIEVQRQRGTMIVFPSYIQHTVTPVTKGKRYSLVSWIYGPRWR